MPEKSDTFVSLAQGQRFESHRGTNVLWQDIDLHVHLPHSTQVMYMGTWQELIP